MTGEACTHANGIYMSVLTQGETNARQVKNNRAFKFNTLDFFFFNSCSPKRV